MRKKKIQMPSEWNTIEHRGPGRTEKFVETIMNKLGFILIKHFGTTSWGREVHSYERRREE